jgi:para-aminobenzoate synthetase component 1
LRRIERIGRAVDLWAVARAVEGDRVALLDNSCDRAELGRWSILGLFPRREIVTRDAGGGTVETLSGPIGDLSLINAEPLDALVEFAQATGDPSHAGDPRAGGPPLAGGAIGYLAYELLHTLEPVPHNSAPPALGDLSHFVEYGAIVAVDQIGGETFVSTHVEYSDAVLDLLAGAPDRRPHAITPRGGKMRVADVAAAGFDPVVSRDEYLDLVERSQDLIRAGNVFELCLTQEFRGLAPAPGVDLHDALRRSSPVPMGAYLRHGALEILCSSPERFLRGDSAGNLETRPVKGTRGRSTDPRLDKSLREELRNAPKDRAENVMIVDLARNDLGRVCEYGSVAVHELCVIESFATVHHLVSTVRGHMRPGLTAADAIRAVFPGGSMTGAPKVEAMRLIAELERSRRGIYSGAIGWLGADGAFDLNIAIRTIVKQGDEASFHTGGAITADSDPQSEHDETMVKARAMVDALTDARGHENRSVIGLDKLSRHPV